MKNSFYALVAVLACFIGIVAARADTIYVGCDGDNTIRQFTTNGVGTVFARDSLDNPAGEAFDKAGNLYVVNQAFDTITKFTTSGVPSTFAADPGDNSILNGPVGLAFDNAGNLYVANEGSSTIEKFNTNGISSTFATDLNGPEGLAFDTANNLYVATDDNYIEKFAPDGTDLGQFGDTTFLDSPVGLAFDSSGNLYVANSDEDDIAMFDTDGNGSVFATNGLDSPEFIAFDTNGNLYVSDDGNNSVEKFDPNGNGTVFIGYDQNPMGLAVDNAGNLYVLNNGNDDSGIDGDFIQEFDSNGERTLFAAATIVDPQGMGFDSAGNLYVANLGLGSVEKFDTNGVPSIFAFPNPNDSPYGLVVDSANNVYVSLYNYSDQILKYTPNGSSSVFGTDDGSDQILSQPQGLAIDSLGNIYAINGDANTISKFTPNGNSSVFAGMSDFYTHGPGVAVDNANNVYCLTNFTEIAKFSPAAVSAPFANDPGQSDTYANVQGMAFDSAGNLYVANYYNGTVMKFDPNGDGSVFASDLPFPSSITIRRDSAASFIPTLTINHSGTNVILSWPLAASAYNLQSNTNLATGNWTTVSGAPGTNLTSFLVTNSITGSIKYFRLSNP